MGTTNRKFLRYFEVAMTVLAATPATVENHKKQTQSETTTQVYQETQRPRWPPKFQRPTSKLAVPAQPFQSNFFIPWAIFKHLYLCIYIYIYIYICIGFPLVETWWELWTYLMLQISATSQSCRKLEFNPSTCLTTSEVNHTRLVSKHVPFSLDRWWLNGTMEQSDSDWAGKRLQNF